jgi:urea transport system permease protein
MSPANSVEIAIWVAVGGRGTLAGAILGAFLVNGAKSWLTVSFPNAWLFLLGALFVGVTLLLPGGIVRIFANPMEARRLLARIRELATPARRHEAPAAKRDDQASPVPPPAPMAVGKEQEP